MTVQDSPELLLLHALPLDASMWDGQKEILPNATYVPTLYSLGDTVEEWAAAVLKFVKGNRLIVVGCSIGGSCALELAFIAPERVAALVLIGTKAHHRPDPVLHASAIETLQQKRMEEAWRILWEPLFSPRTDKTIIENAKRIALRQTTKDVVRGVNAFHSRPSRDPLFSTFPRPIIVVTGADDPAPGLKTSKAQADAATDGRLHVIQNCGHYVPMERPNSLNSILRAVVTHQLHSSSVI